MPDPEKVAEHIRETAQAEILPRFRLLRRADIREKGPGDFVTLADLEAERQLTQRLGGLLPGSVVLGEEAASQDRGRFALLAGEAPVWVIDPVDGTANFARGQPGFAVIVALIGRGAVRAGWIYDPLADTMVMAEAGGGAWSAGQRHTTAAEVPSSEMVGAAYGRTRSGPRAAQALTASGRVGGVRNRGCSGLEYLDIALARAHFSLHSRSLPWDHAAGMLITAEAGGGRAFLDGAPSVPATTHSPRPAPPLPSAFSTVAGAVGALA